MSDSQQESATDYSSDLDSSQIAEKLALKHYCSGTTVTDADNAAPSGDCQSVENASNNALVAIEKLWNIEFDRDMLSDGNVTQELEAFFIDILFYVEAETTGKLHDYKDQDYIRCAISLFDTTFLRNLLILRRQLAHIISNTEPHRSTGVIVTCIDTFFAYCSDFISSFAGSHRNAQRPKDGASFAFHNRREEDNLLVACQLPQTWEQFPGLLRSGRASPASKRLALHILFAAFVVRPDLEDCDPWTEADFKPDYVLECLQSLLEEFIAQAQNLAVTENLRILHPLRTAYTMAIALFASAEAAIQRREAHSSAPFQPHTSASLLELMQFIFPPPSDRPTAVIPWDALDNAQMILLRWGGTTPWAWNKWDDPRVIGFDTVVTLISNWLCHLDRSLSLVLWDDFCERAEGEEPLLTPGWARTLSRVVQANPRASLVALFHQLRDEGSRKIAHDSENAVDFIRLYHTTWCLAELIENCGNMLASDDLSLVAEQLVLFFAELSETSEDNNAKVKEEIIRFLKYLNSDIARKVFLSLHKNISFFTKLANVIANASRSINADPAGRFLLTPSISHGIIALLDFIRLFYICNAASTLPMTTLSLLGDLVKFLSHYCGTPSLRVSLLSCLVCVHGQCQTSRPDAAAGKQVSKIGADSNQDSPAVRLHKTWEEEDAYNLVLDTSGTNLDLAEALASYVSLTIKKSTDPLLVAEAWDYLRDTLIIILVGRLEEYDEGFAQIDFNWEVPETYTLVTKRKALTMVNATEKICTALETVLKRSNAVLVRLLLDSPLTISLHESLNKLIKSARTGPPDGDVDPSNSARLDSPGRGKMSQVDPRVVTTCERFMKWLKKVETDINKMA